MGMDRRSVMIGALATACAPAATTAARGKPVLFHTDLGYDIDDTWALLQLLRTPELDLRLVVTDHNHTRYRAAMTAKLLALAGRSDVPIALGPDPTDDPEAPQWPWLGDFDLATHQGAISEDAPGAIIDFLRNASAPVTVISVGPAPSLAAALARDASIAENAEFVGMFGSVRVGYGAAVNPEPEYNVRVDPAALRTIFAAPWRQCTITPVDTCGLLILRDERYQRVRTSDDPFARAIMDNNAIWAPRAFWMEGYDPTVQSSTLFDSAAIVLAYNEEPFVIETLPIAVRDDGMTVIDEAAGVPVRVATGWRDMDAVLEDVAVRMTGGG